MVLTGSRFHMLGKATLPTGLYVVCYLKFLNLEVDRNIFFSFILHLLVNMVLSYDCFGFLVKKIIQFQNLIRNNLERGVMCRGLKKKHRL